MSFALQLSEYWTWLQLHFKDFFVASLMAFLLYRSVTRVRKNAAAKAKARADAAEKENAKKKGAVAAVPEVKKVVVPAQTVTGTDAQLGSWEYTGQVQSGRRHGNGICTWKGAAPEVGESGSVGGGVSSSSSFAYMSSKRELPRR